MPRVREEGQGSLRAAAVQALVNLALAHGTGAVDGALASLPGMSRRHPVDEDLAHRLSAANLEEEVGAGPQAATGAGDSAVPSSSSSGQDAPPCADMPPAVAAATHSGSSPTSIVQLLLKQVDRALQDATGAGR